MTPDEGVLCTSGAYKVGHASEETFLLYPGGRLSIGDHYGDPSCAFINEYAGWCVSGGEGLIIVLFDEGLPNGPRADEAPPHRRVELWRRDSPPSDGALAWFVEGIWFYQGDLIRVVVDPVSPQAGLYEVNVRTGAWRKMSDAPREAGFFARLFARPVKEERERTHASTQEGETGSGSGGVGQAVCCFCYRPGVYSEMFVLGISPPGSDGERTQGLVCHGACLDKALHPEVPRHPDMYE